MFTIIKPTIHSDIFLIAIPLSQELFSCYPILNMNLQILKKRAEIVKTIRDFFTGKGYLEVETPVLSRTLIPESNIEVFKTHFIPVESPPEPLYLIPSPEIWMKKLLGMGSGNIFQITKSFRNVESTGKYHNPEFTILEWYTVDADYMYSIETTENLIDALSSHSNVDGLKVPFRRMSVEEAFFEFTGIDLASSNDLQRLREQSKKLGLEYKPGDTWEQIFNRIFLLKVEPELPTDRPLVLYNYPSDIACLAKDIPETPWCERWELYIKGIETANCFTEEVNKEKVKEFFQLEKARKEETACIKHPVDETFPDIFDGGFPLCSGVALGVDRLVMALTGASSIEEVLAFPFSRF